MAMIFGIVFFVVGCAGVYWTGRRAFERRNVAGVEEFQSYGSAIGNKFLEGVLRIASFLLIAFGFLLACVGYGMSH